MNNIKTKQKKDYSTYDLFLRMMIIDATNERLKKFLSDTASHYLKEMFPFKKDKISKSYYELLMTVNSARQKYEKEIFSELREIDRIVANQDKDIGEKINDYKSKLSILDEEESKFADSKKYQLSN
jgi:hypothetical protein